MGEIRIHTGPSAEVGFVCIAVGQPIDQPYCGGGSNHPGGESWADELVPCAQVCAQIPNMDNNINKASSVHPNMLPEPSSSGTRSRESKAFVRCYLGAHGMKIIKSKVKSLNKVLCVMLAFATDEQVVGQEAGLNGR